MTNNNLPKFFVTQSGLGFEAGIYDQDEIKKLPKSVFQYTISLAVAEAMGYVTLDHQAGKNINELDAFSNPEYKTDKVIKFRGVLEGSLKASSPLSQSADKLGNALRDKLQTFKQKSAEDNLKAQIEAKKKALGSSK